MKVCCAIYLFFSHSVCCFTDEPSHIFTWELPSTARSSSGTGFTRATGNWELTWGLKLTALPVGWFFNLYIHSFKALPQTVMVFGRFWSRHTDYFLYFDKAANSAVCDGVFTLTWSLQVSFLICSGLIFMCVHISVCVCLLGWVQVCVHVWGFFFFFCELGDEEDISLD